MRDLLDPEPRARRHRHVERPFLCRRQCASTDEVAEVAKPLGKWGGVYTAHMRDEAKTS